VSARAAPQLDAICRHGRQELAAGRISAAQHAALRVLKADQDNAEAYLLLGMAAAAAGRPEKAEDFIARALRLNPDSGEACIELARVKSMRGSHSEALIAAASAERHAQSTGYFWDSLGVVYSRAQDFDSALRCFRHATRHSPETPGYFFNLGSTLQFLGLMAEAEDAYQRAIDIQPRFYRAHFALAAVTSAESAERYLPRLRELREHLRPGDKGNIYVNFALGELYDKLERYDEAFDALNAANSAMRDVRAGDVAALGALADRSMEKAQRDPRSSGCSSREPIFVLGMPRTGTTLVDRILSNHSQVHSAGELTNLRRVLKRATGSSAGSILDEQMISGAAGLDWESLGRHYVESTRPATGHTPFFIDKTPLNFLLIGFINRALPNARIICLHRHPMDTVLGNFRQLFALQVPDYDYAYSLEDCARYYLLFDRLMRHWDTQLPGRVLRVDYEELVLNQETQSRRIVEHCGLDWEPACLAFEENAAPVATASAVQVREGLYSRAVGRWKRYERQLEPARRILEDAGIAL